jgi:hypothetical protein
MKCEKFVSLANTSLLSIQDLSELIAQTSLHAFINEACGDAVNMGLNSADDEENLIYNPMRDRQIHIFHTASPNSHIAKGSEFLYKNIDGCRDS